MRITESQLRKIVREEMSMSSNTNRTFRAIMQQVGEDGRTSLRDLSPSSSYAAKESSLRQAQEAGLLTVGSNFRDSWVELTDAGYDWLAANVSTEFGVKY